MKIIRPQRFLHLETPLQASQTHLPAVLELALATTVLTFLGTMLLNYLL
jgi:hypothetical protein